MNRVKTKLPKLPTLLLTLLLIISVVELAVMMVLPNLMLKHHSLAESLVDSLLLSLCSAPLLWLIIIKPFRQIARMQEQRAESVLLQITEGVIGCDPRGRINFLNQSAEKLFGYPMSDAVGMELDTLLPGLGNHPNISGPTDGISEHTARCADGSHRPVAVSFSVQKPPAAWHYLVIARDISERYAYEKQLRANEERLEYLLTSSASVLYSCEVSGDYAATFISQNIERITGYTAQEFLATPGFWAEHIHPDDAPQVFAELPRLFETDNHIHRYRWRHKDGHYIWMRDELRLVRDVAGNPVEIVGTWLDITARQEAEMQLQRANRALIALSKGQEALLYAANETELLESICRIIVEDGGFTLVWVGYAEMDEARSVRPVAQRGFEDGYLQALHLSWADSELGRGPTGTAIRTGRPTVANDIRTDPRFAPWRAEALRRGYASSIALPLIAGSERLGALNIYSATADAFDEEEAALLTKLARNLAYGIASLRTSEQRQQAEDALRESEEKYRTTMDSTLVGIYIIQDRMFKYVNPEMTRLFIYPPEEMTDKLCLADLIATEQSGMTLSDIERRIMESPDEQHELKGLRRDGSTFDALIWSRRVTYLRRPAMVGTIVDISERKQAQQEHERLYQEQQAITTAITDVMLMVDLEARLQWWNRSVEEVTGLTEADLKCRPLHHFFPPEISDAVQSLSDQGFATGSIEQELPLLSITGPIPYEFKGAVLRNRAGDARGMTLIGRDISEQKKRTAQIRQLSLALEQSATIAFITDRQGRIEYVNPEFEKATGYTRDEVLGRPANLLKSGKNSPELYREMWATLLRGEVFRDVLINRRKNGELYYEEKSIAPLLDEQGLASHFIATGMDVTQRQQDQERLNFLAYHDLLTGLPNRALLEDRLDQAITRADRTKQCAALLFIDLDNFKVINDSLGHEIGDKLLIETAERFKTCVREVDTIARPGGDEFTILMEGITLTDQVALIAENILNSLAAPYIFEGQELFVTASIGIAIFPNDAADSSELFKCAETTMYHAKDSGRNNYQFYSEKMTIKVMRQLTLDHKLRNALEKEEFRIFYQPKVDFRSGQVIGAEALLRWEQAGEGMIYPDEFIPRLEASGLILPVGEWIIATAATHWQVLREIVQPSNFRLAINFSPKQFQQHGLAERVLSLLNAGAFPAENLIVEVTESAVMGDIEASIETLQTLRRHGIKIAMDDFGTGYSSLSYLKRLPLDELKIDRTFVTGLPDDEDDVQLVTAILSMAHSMKLHVVAEGVETEEQRELLKSLECDTLQGYLFSRPLPFEDLVSMLKEQIQM